MKKSSQQKLIQEGLHAGHCTQRIQSSYYKHLQITKGKYDGKLPNRAHLDRELETEKKKKQEEEEGKEGGERGEGGGGGEGGGREEKL